MIILQNKNLVSCIGESKIGFSNTGFCVERMKSDLSVRQPRYISRTFGRWSMRRSGSSTNKKKKPDKPFFSSRSPGRFFSTNWKSQNWIDWNLFLYTHHPLISVNGYSHIKSICQYAPTGAFFQPSVHTGKRTPVHGWNHCGYRVLLPWRPSLILLLRPFPYLWQSLLLALRCLVYDQYS